MLLLILPDTPMEWVRLVMEIGGAISLFFVWRGRRRTSTMSLINEYKKLWIEQAKENIKLSKNVDQAARILSKVKNRCEQCYEELAKELGQDVEKFL